MKVNITEARGQEILEEYGVQIHTFGNCLELMSRLNNDELDYLNSYIRMVSLAWLYDWGQRSYEIAREQIASELKPMFNDALEARLSYSRVEYLPEEEVEVEVEIVDEEKV